MAAPVGNQFWKLRSKHGRDRLFEDAETLWEAACEYFQWCDDNPFYEVEQAKSPGKPHISDDGKVTFPPNLIDLPKMRAYTLHGLCIYLDCNTVYFNHFESSLKGRVDEKADDFSKVITRIRETIYEQKFTGAASGFLNANIIARDLGLAEKSDFTSKGEQIKSPVLKLPDGTTLEI